ncbi:MAG: amidohydrolase family protein, partial [Longimicrobiales bacterium]
MRRAKAKLLLAALMLTMVAAPAAAQPRVGEVGMFLIRGGTVITVAGQQIENASVLIQDGRIAAVGTNVTAPADATVIDATGKFVYPGMIDSYTPLGLTEVGGINTMNLRSE